MYPKYYSYIIFYVVLIEKTKSMATKTEKVYMIIERFHGGKQKVLYQRLKEKGRMLPEGVKYMHSWINESVTICYQVMETDDEVKIQEWINNWCDLADFEVIPVMDSAHAKQKVLGKK